MQFETLSKLYLELSHVVPDGTKTAKELALQRAIENALRELDFATPQQRNGPCIKAAGILRAAIGLAPMTLPGGKPSEGLWTPH